MSKAIGRGVLVLTISGLICKIIGAFFRLPLTYILGVEGIGVFQLVMSVFSFALVLTSGGISVTLSKIISSLRAKREFGKIRWYIYISISYCVVISFLFGLAFLFLSREIASIQNATDASLSYKFFFPLLLFSSLVSVFRGVEQGYENMTPTAISQILEQLSKFVFGLIFALLFGRNSIANGVLGVIFGILIGEVLAFIYLLLSRHKHKLSKVKYERAGRKDFFRYFIPSTLGLAVTSFVHFVDSMVFSSRLKIAGISSEMSTSLFGLQTGIVGSFLNFPIIISIALSTSILPTLSYEKNDKKQSEDRIKKAFFVLWASVLPITFGMLAISLPLYQTLYPFFDRNMLLYAIRLTAIGAISTILLALSQLYISILQARGMFRYVFVSQLVGGVAKVLCTIFLCAIPSINIYGLAIGNVAFSSIVLISCLVEIKRETFIDARSFFMPLLASLTMLVFVGYFSVLIKLPSILNLIISVFIGVVIYAFMTFPLLKVLKQELFGKKEVRGGNEQERTT